MITATEQIAAGQIPASREELARIGIGLVRIGAKVRQTLAVIVAAARRSFGRTGKADWIDWCTRELGLDGNDRSHLCQVGTMLLDIRELKPSAYVRFFALDIDKLLALAAVARLESAAAVIALASHFDLAAMTRAEVRLEVLRHLGDPRADVIRDKAAAAPGEKLEQPSLPGFDEIWAAAGNFDDDDFVRACDTPEKAAKSMELGIGFLSGALEYSRAPEHRDTVKLAMLKSILLEQLAAIENVLGEN